MFVQLTKTSLRDPEAVGQITEFAVLEVMQIDYGTLAGWQTIDVLLETATVQELEYGVERQIAGSALLQEHLLQRQESASGRL